MSGPMALTIVVMSCYMLGGILIARKKKLLHGLFMACGMLVDLALTVYLVLESHVLPKAIGQAPIQVSHTLLYVHISVALLTLVGYFMMTGTGIPLLRSVQGGPQPAYRLRRDRHAWWSVPTLILYLATVFTIPTQGSVVSWVLKLTSS